MPDLFSEPLIWAAIVGVCLLLLLLGLAAVRLAGAEERARAGERHFRDAQALKAELDRIGREQEARVAALSAADARATALADNFDRVSADADSLRAERDALDRALAALRAEARGFERQIADLRQAKEEMRLAFSENAGALMASHSETFKAQNREQIETILAPLKNDIDAFRRSLTDAHEKSAAQHGSLKEQLEQLGRQSAAVSKEAENLTRALKGDVQMQGAWGEMIVDTILNRLGLRDGVEYSRQESFSGEDGRARTDYIVNLPSGERLIVDSKVSLVDFEAYVNEADEGVRRARLSAHARSMRAHMKALASKDYQSRVGTRLDFVIMFVPIEAALGAALSFDEMLSLDALDNKVAIATPTTLTTQLKTVAAMWRVERQHRNAEEIAARAGALYDKFVGFVGDLEDIGVRLGQTQKSYEKAFGKLSGGPGNLVRQAEMLKALGATTGKGIARPLLEAADAADPETLLQLETRRSDDKPGDLVQ